MIELFGQVAFAVALAACAFAIGRRLLTRLASGAAAEDAAFAVALGLGVIAQLLLALALVGLLRRGPVLLVLGVALALSWRGLRRPRVSPALGAACLLLGLLALYPSTAWDANSYHLPAAAWFVEHARLAPAWPLRYAVFPQSNELLFSLGLLAGDARSAQLVEALFCAVVALALHGAGSRRSPRAGAWAAALWLGSPLVLRLGTIAYTDVALAAYTTLTVLALDRWLKERRLGWLVLASAFAGFAASTKYLGLFAVALVLVTVLARRRAWRELAAASLVSLAIAGPWYGYIALSTGGPLFPFFGHGPWSAADLALQLDEMRAHGCGRSLLDALALPWRLAFRQQPFAPELPVSPLLWVALGPIAFVARRDREVRRWAAIALAWIACWFCGVQLYRYLLPALALLALAGGVVLAELVRARTALIAAALFSLGGAWAAWELAHRGPLPLGVERRTAWLDARMPAHRAIRFAAQASHGARIYQLDLEDHLYYAGSNTVGDWFGEWRYARLLAHLGDAAAFTRALDATGARWLVAPLPSFRGNLQIPASPRLSLRYSDPNAVVYELTPTRSH